MSRTNVQLAAEVAGYRRLVADDAQETQRRLTSLRSAIAELIAGSSGQLTSSDPENLRAEFSSALLAGRCALAIQDAMRARNAAYPPSRQIQFRIGIAPLEAELMQLRAAPGGVCVSREVRDEIDGELPIRFVETNDSRAFKVEMRREDGSFDTPRAPPPPKPVPKIPLAIPLMIVVVGGLVIASGAMIFQAREDLKRVTLAAEQQQRDSVFDIKRLAWLPESSRTSLASDYASAAPPKAMTIAANNQAYIASGKSSVSEAATSSLAACRAAGHVRCVMIAKNDTIAVALPGSSRIVGLFAPETSNRLAEAARSSVTQRLSKASGGWSAVASGMKGLPGIALDAPSESDATAGALEACAEQDTACRIIAIGPFAVAAD